MTVQPFSCTLVRLEHTHRTVPLWVPFEEQIILDLQAGAAFLQWVHWKRCRRRSQRAELMHSPCSRKLCWSPGVPFTPRLVSRVQKSVEDTRFSIGVQLPSANSPSIFPETVSGHLKWWSVSERPEPCAKCVECARWMNPGSSKRRWCPGSASSNCQPH